MKRYKIRSIGVEIFSAGGGRSADNIMLMVGEKRSGWGIQRFKIMHMRKSKGQRTSSWSILKFKNMLMSPSKGQRTSGWSIC